MTTAEKRMIIAGGVALVFTLAAVAMAAIQALATPSGTFVVGAGPIAITGIIGMIGLAAFGFLWATKKG